MSLFDWITLTMSIAFQKKKTLRHVMTDLLFTSFSNTQVQGLIESLFFS